MGEGGLLRPPTLASPAGKVVHQSVRLPLHTDQPSHIALLIAATAAVGITGTQNTVTGIPATIGVGGRLQAAATVNHNRLATANKSCPVTARGISRYYYQLSPAILICNDTARVVLAGM